MPFDETNIDRRPLRSEHAVNALQRIISTEQAAKSVTLVCCGPLTNIALAIRMYGCEFLRRVRDIHIMGGNYNAIGNVRGRVCSEFNFYADPEAARIVLDACTVAAVPVTMLPWEACSTKTLPIPTSWRFDVLARHEHHPIVRWLTPIEEAIWRPSRADGLPTYGMCDALLVGCLLFPERLVRRQRRRKCTVELQGVHTRGQVVVDHGGSAKEDGNVMMIELLDVEECKKLMLWTVDAAEMCCK